MIGYGKLYASKGTVLMVIITTTLLLASSVATAFGPGKKHHIVFLISEDPDNYEAHKTIPAFADLLQREHGFKVSVLLGEGDRSAFHFPGLEVISEADLLVVFCRRVALSHKQLGMIRNYLQQGKPLVGLRTANHAFSVRDEIKSGYEAWWDFVPLVLGCENRGYGPTAPGTDVSIVPEASKHPVLKGVKSADWHSKGNVYLVAPLLDKKATVLLTGKVEEQVEPIAWTRNTVHDGRVFYTSLGYPADFELPQFRKLLFNGIYWALDLTGSKKVRQK